MLENEVCSGSIAKFPHPNPLRRFCCSLHMDGELMSCFTEKKCFMCKVQTMYINQVLLSWNCSLLMFWNVKFCYPEDVLTGSYWAGSWEEGSMCHSSILAVQLVTGLLCQRWSFRLLCKYFSHPNHTKLCFKLPEMKIPFCVVTPVSSVMIFRGSELWGTQILPKFTEFWFVQYAYFLLQKYLMEGIAVAFCGSWFVF